MRRLIAPMFFGAILLLAGETVAQQPAPQPQQPQIFFVQRRPCLLRPFARMRWNARFTPRFVAFGIHASPLMERDIAAENNAKYFEWVPGHWRLKQR